MTFDSTCTAKMYFATAWMDRDAKVNPLTTSIIGSLY